MGKKRTEKAAGAAPLSTVQQDAGQQDNEKAGVEAAPVNAEGVTRAEVTEVAAGRGSPVDDAGAADALPPSPSSSQMPAMQNWTAWVTKVGSDAFRMGMKVASGAAAATVAVTTTVGKAVEGLGRGLQVINDPGYAKLRLKYEGLYRAGGAVPHHDDPKFSSYFKNVYDVQKGFQPNPLIENVIGELRAILLPEADRDGGVDFRYSYTIGRVVSYKMQGGAMETLDSVSSQSVEKAVENIAKRGEGPAAAAVAEQRERAAALAVLSGH